jgi:hypothetical protein
VRYLIVGGYAVAYHGYPRATGDLDLWIAIDSDNAERMVTALREFCFDLPELSTDLFLSPGRIIRMGEPPFRIEVLTSVSGVEFEECYRERVAETFGSVEVSIISLKHLKANKRAAGRHQDLSDLEHLP